MSLKPPESGEIIQATFTNKLTLGQITLSLNLRSNELVTIKQTSADSSEKENDKKFARYFRASITRGVAKTSPSSPGYIWNILKDIDRTVPGIISKITYETKPSDDAEGRIY